MILGPAVLWQFTALRKRSNQNGALPAFVWVPPSMTWSLPGLSGTPASAPPGVTLPGVAGRKPSEIPLSAAGTTAAPQSVSAFLPGNASVGSPAFGEVGTRPLRAGPLTP